uniref:DNA cross-link repair 1A protein n=1 Tax=Naja naja TaxID=35670 RepID=A0A8C6XCG5_NAJNA
MAEDGLSEEDIWEYKSIRKQKPTSQHSEVIATEEQKVKPRQRGSQTLVKPGVCSGDPIESSQEDLSTTLAKETKICKRQNSEKARPVFEGYCPSCQMPFSLLLIQTPQWHVTECLDVSGTAEKECPDGILCSSVIPSHYKRYSHFQLAKSRAQDFIFAPSLFSAENYFIRPSAAEHNEFSCRVLQDVKVSQSTEKSKQSLLLPQQSSMTMDSINVINIMASSLGNIKKPEHTIQHIDEPKLTECLNLFSEETQTENQSEVVEKFNNLDVKLKTTINTCGNRALKNNSCLVKEKEEGSCKSIAMPILPSTVSKTQPHPATNTEVQISPPKRLKQMDIGVFFGLQPKVKSKTPPQKNLSEERVIVNPSAANGNKLLSRKRKAEGSVGETDTVTKSSSIKYDTKSDSISGGQRRQKKRYRESYPGEDGIKKQCPFYKKIPGTGFVVDAFQYGEIEGCSAYFLTHFHSDHYGGLTKKFTFPIYCNKITGNLVKNKLGVQEQYVHILPMDRECIIDNIKVVLVDANHCPGATMILFCLPNGTVILHTGDFRANPSMERCPFLNSWRVHTVYLDTTYCSPEYTFPSQQEVIQFAVNTAFEQVTLNPRTLVVCGTYSVGKEKVFLAIAEVLGSKVSMSQEKYKILQCLESATINSLITLNWNNTFLHLLPMMQINFKNLQNHLNKFSEKFDHILAFKPTGWTYSDGCYSLSDIKPQTRRNITIYGIPYSEHSSFLEMKRFIQWLKPQKIIPTVNVGNWKVRHEMERYFKDWKMEVAEWN